MTEEGRYIDMRVRVDGLGVFTHCPECGNEWFWTKIGLNENGHSEQKTCKCGWEEEVRQYGSQS